MPSPPRHLVVATDLGEASANATRRALSLAKTLGARLSLLYLVEPLPMVSSWGDPTVAAWVDVDILQGAGETALQRHRATLGLDTREDIDSVVRIGLPRRDLGLMAQSLGGDLLVLGLRGERRIGDRLLGSTAQAAVHHCPLPLLLIRKPAASPWQHLMAATDFSDAARRAADLATDFAIWRERRLLHVVSPLPEATLGLVESTVPVEAYTQAISDEAERGLSEEAHRLGEGWIPQLRHGSVAETVLAETTQHATDLLAIGSHGHGPWLGRLLGSVGQSALALSGSDVLLAAR